MKMKYLKELLMLVVSLLVLNVWLLRFNQETIYRGGNALNMIQEFAVYGLSETTAYIIGALKVLSATGLLVGFFYKKSIVPSASLMAALMCGAILMHLRVNDEAIKFLPAGLMLISSLMIVYLDRKTISA
jgi:hypothetical protein|tara:strand:- start:19 stop:408 length:390 start_codon:yes stop_codon:yes gene_type:complete